MVFLNIVSTPGPGLSRSRPGLARLVTRLAKRLCLSKLVTRLTCQKTRLVKARARSLTIKSKHIIRMLILYLLFEIPENF